MPAMTPEQLRRREQVESIIRLAAPVLNLVLAVGERVSRLVEPDDHEYYPPRARSQTPDPPSGQTGNGARASGE